MICDVNKSGGPFYSCTTFEKKDIKIAMSSEHGNIYIPMHLSGNTCRTPMNFVSLKRLKRCWY